MEQSVVTQAVPDPLQPPPEPAAEAQVQETLTPPAERVSEKQILMAEPSKMEDQTGDTDSNLEKLKQINKLILRSKNLPDSVDESEHEAKIIMLVESIDLPSEMNDLLNLYSDLRVLKLRTKNYVPDNVDEALMSMMRKIIETAKLKFGMHPRVSVLEKDFNKLKREKYMMMLLGLAVIVMILFLIFK